MAKKKRSSKKKIANMLARAKADAEKSALGIFVHPPFYIHSNIETLRAAETVVAQQLRSMMTQTQNAIFDEFRVLKQIVANKEQSLFAALNQSLTDTQIKQYFGGSINRENFIKALQEVYTQTDIVVAVDEARALLSTLPSGDKNWGQLKQIIDQYEKMNDLFRSDVPNNFHDSAIAQRLQSLCKYYEQLKNQNKQTQDSAIKQSRNKRSGAQKIKVSNIDKLDANGKPMSNLFGLGKNYLQQTVFPQLYEVGLTQAGMQLCEALGLQNVENKLIASQTGKGTSSDTITFSMGISVKSSSKIHQVKDRALTTFLTPMTGNDSLSMLNQGYNLSYGEDSTQANALSYLLINHAVLGLQEETMLLILRILSWISLNEKLFGYNKREQLDGGLNLEQIVDQMPVFTFVGQDQTFIYMGDLLDKLEIYLKGDFKAIDKVVRYSHHFTALPADEFDAIQMLKYNIIKSITNHKMDISYSAIKPLWEQGQVELQYGDTVTTIQFDRTLQDYNAMIMQNFAVRLAYTFDWKKISRS